MAERYTIERELGRGGNAVVYLAHDRRHDRKVALKVLQPELALAVRAERFLREIQISAKLSHPHILPLYDSGEIDGVVFYVMPHVEGESLRDRLKREKQLPLDTALRITTDVAEALSYAHGRGVVHRDIKPENILLSEGGAIVADFGIARALTTASDAAVTESGIAVGTPAYMSPEQAAGDGEVDGRSDVYSLGCVLFEMLTGHPPFTGTSAQEILARHTLDPVPTVRAGREAVPDGVERAIRRALAKQPADRFTSATVFAAALMAGSVTKDARRTPILIAAGVGLLLLIGGTVYFGRLVARPGPAATEFSLAVLPCKPLTVVGPEDKYFSEGMAAELITMLSKVPGLRVPALTSTLAAEQMQLSMRQIGDSLGVTHVLTCTVRRGGGRLRLGASLENVADGSQVWAETFDRELNAVIDMIAIQEDVARSVVGALPSNLLVPTASLTRQRTADPVADDLYRLGQYWDRLGGEHFQRAIDYFTQAVERDSNFALAYADLASVYVGAAASGFLPRRAAHEKARIYANKALKLDDQLAEAHVAMGQVYYWADWNWDGATDELKKSFALNPKLATGHIVYGQLLSLQERFDEAAEQATLARRLDGLSTNVSIGSTFLFARRYADAIREYQRVAQLAPEYHTAHGNLGRAYIASGRFPEAISALERARALGSPVGNRGQLAFAYANSHRMEEARKLLAEILERSKTQPVWGGLAWAYLALGDRENAVKSLVAAVTNQSVNPGFIAEPVWDDLRSHSRIKELRRELHLPE